MFIQTFKGLTLPRAWLIIFIILGFTALASVFAYYSPAFDFFTIQQSAYILSCFGIVIFSVVQPAMGFEFVPRFRVNARLLIATFFMSAAIACMSYMGHVLLPLPSNEFLQFAEVKIDTTYNIIAGVFLLVFAEEFLFRGIILEGLQKRYTPTFSVVLSAIIFSVAHLDPVQLLPMFLLGLLTGFLYQKLRDLCMSIFAHLLFNIAQATALPAASNNWQLSPLLLYTILAAAALVLVLGYLNIRKYAHFHKAKMQQMPKQVAASMVDPRVFSE
ncbi:CPBP family intramembrane glutamic endopeptidase [Chitinophaga skermanii]|nr:type II CAAX endopeptidase family protein [Chitinophaga skermanii]